MGQLLTLPIFSMFDAIDILNLNTAFGNALNLGSSSAFIGGILLTIILDLFVIALPLYKRMTSICLVLTIMVCFATTALGWLNIFVTIVTVLVIALGLAEKFTGIFKEHGLGR